jgi:hypothetical protein
VGKKAPKSETFAATGLYREDYSISYTFVMKLLHRSSRIAVFALTFLFLASAIAGAQNLASATLGSQGFDISAEELCELLSLQRSIRLDPPAKIEADWSGRLQKLRVRELEKSENRYAYAFDIQRGRQIIAVRGTANLTNALLDLESWKDLSPVLGIKLHHGFEKAASMVFEDARQYLDFKLPVVVCGHSLGAAEAIILGMLLSKAGYRVEKILASGPPKVTDAKGVAAYENLPVVLVTSAFDPVPFLPPALLYPSQPFVQWGPLLMLLDGPYATVVSPRFYDEISPAFNEAKQYSEHFDVVDHRVWTYYDRAREKLNGIEFVPFDEWPTKAVPRK